MIKGEDNPKFSKLVKPRKILNFSVYLFLFATLVIALLRLMPWSAPLAVIEIPLNYLPRWLPLLLISPLLFYWRHAIQLSSLRLALLCLGIIYIVFLHMDFVVSVKGFARVEEKSNLRILSANLIQVAPIKFGALLRYKNPDVIVTQEIRQPELAALLREVSGPVIVSSELDSDSRNLVSDAQSIDDADLVWRLHCEKKLCMASRYPFDFVEAQSRRFRGAWGLLGAAYDLDVGGEPLRIFNVHLETVRKGFENVSFRHLDLDGILKNANIRKLEAELLAGWVGQQRPVVVVGDFNMTTGESLYREYFGRFRNAYAEVGFGRGHTKLTRLLGVRIDHLLSTADVSPVAAQVCMDVGSDHRPLLVDLALGR